MTTETITLARIPMAIAQTVIYRREDGQHMAYNQYWTRHTGSTNDITAMYAKGVRQPAEHAHSGPFADRETAIEDGRERALAWFYEVQEQAAGKAKTEAAEMITRLRAFQYAPAKEAA
jgi:hypothetical protein